MQSTLVFTSLLCAFVVNATPLHSLSTRASIDVAGYEYAGCYTEAVGKRAFSGKSYFDDNLTIEKCAAACDGYRWFGLEYGRECYCGDAPNIGSVKVQEARCSFSCPGNSAESCGAGDHLTTYAKTGTVTYVPETLKQYGSLGCYSEGTDRRALRDAYFINSTLTIEKCASLCDGFSFFGLEYRQECFCGNDLADSSVSVSNLECPYACPGDNTQTCGGDRRLNLFAFGAASIPPPTPESTYARQACYTETKGERALSGKSYFDDLMTVEKCAKACAGYTWFGVEYGRECYCGNAIRAESTIVDDSNCSFDCPGDATEKCGAGDHLDMYKFGVATVSSSVSSSVVSSTTVESSSASSTSETTVNYHSNLTSSSTTSESPSTTESSSMTSETTTTTESSTVSSTTTTTESPSPTTTTTTLESTTTTTTTTTSPSPTTTSTTTTTTTTTTTAAVASCTVQAGVFKAQATDHLNTPLQIYANLPNGEAGGTFWQPPSTSQAAQVKNKYLWTIDAQGFLILAYNIPPYSYRYHAYVRTVTNPTDWPQVDVSTYVDSLVSRGFAVKITACFDSISGELKLNAGGRTNILWCGSQMWISTGNGAEINRGVCEFIHPKPIWQ